VPAQVARELEAQYALAYPSPWPNLGLHCATLAKLESYAGSAGRAADAAARAVQQLQATHGGDSSALEEMARLRHELQMEAGEGRRRAT
jgi:hypothetical protein